MIVIGDIGIDVLKQKGTKDKQIVEKYQNLMAANGLEILIDSPTHEEMLNCVNPQLITFMLEVAVITIEVKFGKKKVSDHCSTLLTLQKKKSK